MSTICPPYGSLLQFADDTTLICSGDTGEEVEKKLCHNLELISNWISQSKMWLNVNKSSVTWFSSKHSKRKSEYPLVLIDDQPLTAVTQQCYLGIIFVCCLEWKAQVSEVCRKCSYYLYLIGCSHKHLPVKLLMESLISLCIMYALPVWGPLFSIIKLAVYSVYRIGQ